MTEKDFLVQAAIGGFTEIQLGRLAVERTRSETVREYARRIVEVYTRASGELAELARMRGVSLPDEPDRSHSQLVGKIVGFSGQDFDREYLTAAMTDHRETIPAMREQCANPQASSEMKCFAARYLARLEQQYYSAESLRREEGL